jgi:hypothetical protein
METVKLHAFCGTEKKYIQYSQKWRFICISTHSRGHTGQNFKAVTRLYQIHTNYDRAYCIINYIAVTQLSAIRISSCASQRSMVFVLHEDYLSCKPPSVSKSVIIDVHFVHQSGKLWRLGKMLFTVNVSRLIASKFLIYCLLSFHSQNYHVFVLLLAWYYEFCLITNHVIFDSPTVSDVWSTTATSSSSFMHVCVWRSCTLSSSDHVDVPTGRL